MNGELDALRPYVADLLARRGDGQLPRVFALHYERQVDGEIIHEGNAVHLRWCPSELAVREALVDQQRPDTLVLLTPVTELGADVLGRLTLHRLAHPRPAEALLHLFGIPAIDPAIPSWMMAALVASAPPDGYERSGARTLDLDRAWRALALHVHRIELNQGLAGLLRWAGSEHAMALTALEGERRTDTLDWLESELPGARLVLAAASAGQGGRVVPLGLVLRTILDGTLEAPRVEARTRFELLLGTTVEERGASAWAQAAEAELERLDAENDAVAQSARHEAERLLDELHAGPLAEASALLRSGLRARLHALGAALESRDGIEEATLAVASHHLAVRTGATRVATYATRLVRWLSLPDPAAPADLVGAARAYVDSSCYADLARNVLRHGGEERTLDRALGRLVATADARRADEERRFAALLSAWSVHAETTGELLGVEDLLRELVAPLAEMHPVLVVVLDGMSHRVAAELLEDALADGWTELRRAAQPGRTLALAALPSVTTYSRASLFAGALVRGLAADEEASFAAHPALLVASGRGLPPLLFHKRALRDAHVGLSGEVRGEIASERRVVGAVVNAIDDHLARSEQLRSDWSVRDITPLAGLLGAARESDRIVVLLSDHGHVIEREGGVPRPHSGQGGERWREASTPAKEDEVLAEGPRVLASGGRCVMAVDEGLRYSPKKHGYHGGATAQEMLAPAIVLCPVPVEGLVGWCEAPNDPPTWWTGVRTVSEPEQVERRRARSQREGQLSFGMEERSWLEELLVSETLAAQRKLAARTPLSNERIVAVLSALEARGGKLLRPALAQACGLAPARLSGTLAALGLLLNVEGYAILSVDEASDTVELNTGLLREQFGLGPEQ